MKFSAALTLAAGPMALAKAVRNVYPVAERAEHLGKSKQVSNGQLVNIPGIAAGSVSQVIIIWVNGGGGAATSTVNKQVTVTTTVTAGAPPGQTGAPPPPGQTGGGGPAPMATHSVEVGGAAGLVFTPPEIKANVGDMVVFTFKNANHTVTQSAFDTPCDPLANGLDSGFQPNPNNTIIPAPQVAMQVMDLKPLWFFCKQGPHCGKGMVFSVNPTAEKTHALFQSMAIQQKGKGAGSPITGNSTAPPVAPPPPPPAGTGLATPSGVATPAGPAGGVATGVGSFDPNTGVCTCAVAVGAGAFPVQAQGVGAFGGFGGQLPAAMMERSP